MNTLDYKAFIILALATWRLASLFSQETGPFNIFLRIRTLAGIEHDDGGMPIMIPDRFLAQLLSCLWCTSIWCGLLFLAWFLYPTITMYVAWPLALSAVAIAIDRGLSR